MDIADLTDHSVLTPEGTQMNKIMSAGISLQAGHEISVPARYKDPKWAEISPKTITAGGQQRGDKKSGQGVITTSGAIDNRTF